MTANPFRFGVVAAQARSGKEWAELARRVESLGFSTFVMPDGVQHLFAPFPALAAAATATSDLRVGPYVAANDYRHPVMLAKEAATLDVLSDGRLELGIGAGRPDAERDLAMMGKMFDRGGVRVERLAESIGIAKALFAGEWVTLEGAYYTLSNAAINPKPVQQSHPPILIAAAGEKMLALAGREADIVAFGVPPTATETDLAERIDILRFAAGDRFSQIELNLNLMGVGSRIHPWIERKLGLSVDQLRAMNAVSCLFGSAVDMADQLELRRAQLGVAYYLVGEEFIEDFAPVVATLRGR